jgi:hypothetical protein
MDDDNVSKDSVDTKELLESIKKHATNRKSVVETLDTEKEHNDDNDDNKDTTTKNQSIRIYIHPNLNNTNI